jgi:hypothetical protein
LTVATFHPTRQPTTTEITLSKDRLSTAHYPLLGLLRR